MDDMRQKRDLVERLREALRSIAANTCCDRCQEAALVARAALGTLDTQAETVSGEGR